MSSTSRRGSGARWQRISFGVWVPNPYDGTSAWTTALASFATVAGKAPNVATSYIGWADTDTSYIASWGEACRAHGQTLSITWEPWDPDVGGSTQATYKLSTISAGTHDTYITAFAAAAAAWGRPLILRFAHEMNGDWYPWTEVTNGNSAGQYVTAWRHIKAIFVAQGASNVRFLWCPNVSIGSTAMSALYPGDAYVDYIGLDGYNFGTTGGSTWQTFSEVFTDSIAEILAVTAHKPLYIPETGCSVDGGNKATWITDMWTQLAATPAIRGVWWFDEDQTGDGAPNWRIESSSPVTAAFAAGVANARYARAAT